MKKILTLGILLFIFIGCGYKPASYYAKNAVTGNVYVEVPVDIDNTKSSVFIKDYINSMVLNRFNANLTNQKSLANSIIVAKLLKVSHIALTSDNLGYVKTYKALVAISLEYKKQNSKKRKLSVSNYYNYSVNSDSSLNEQQKQEAVQLAVKKAIDDIFSRIAISDFKE